MLKYSRGYKNWSPTDLYLEPNQYQLLSNHVPLGPPQVSTRLFPTYKYELQDYLEIWPTLQIKDMDLSSNL